MISVTNVFAYDHMIVKNIVTLHGASGKFGSFRRI